MPDRRIKAPGRKKRLSVPFRNIMISSPKRWKKRRFHSGSPLRVFKAHREKGPGEILPAGIHKRYQSAQV